MTAWHALTIEETKRALGCLSPPFAPNRLIGQEGTPWPVMLLRQFQSMLVLILAVAVLLSFMIGDKIDACAILAIVVLNACLGFAQEWKAESTLQGLKQMLAPRCRVRRGGREQEIDATSLIPGDYVLLSAGNAIPADLRLAEAVNLRVDESALTGESLAVAKRTEALPEDCPVALRDNVAFMGTHVVNGYGAGFVVATGMDTAFGQIAGLTSTIKETQTNLQRQLGVLGRQLGVLALLVSAAVFAVGWGVGHDPSAMAMTGISLAVAAVPEGLPAVVTITLALGMGTMARKKALLRRLQAAETLGAVSVICTDKTGTLTCNQMTAQAVWTADGLFQVTGAGYETDGQFLLNDQPCDPPLFPGLMKLLDTGRVCNHARLDQAGHVIGAPTEAALIVVADKAGLHAVRPVAIVAEHSFNSTRKRMSIVEQEQDRLVVHVKGAPEVILPLCSFILKDGGVVEMTDEYRRNIERAYSDMACRGMRTLALARRETPDGGTLDETAIEADLVFLGIVGMIDPPRPEVREALARAESAGIRILMITGDSPDTALAVARQIGLSAAKAVTGDMMRALSDEELSALLQDDILFARTVPEDKYRIVKLLQADRRLVAMTGDGVNDAPALKQADIGIAMGIRGTDVAKGAADIVLADDNFATIVAAIEEGRRQYTNISKFVRFLVSHSIGEVSAVFLNILTAGPLILLPLQILWINLATDSVTALALSVEKAERDIMNERPRRIGAALIGKRDLAFLAACGLYVGVATLGLFHIYLGQSYERANSIAFTMIVMTAQMLVFNFRHLHGPVAAIGWFSNPWILLAVAAMTLMQAAALYWPPLNAILHTVPLAVHDWGVILLAALPLFIVPEAVKLARARL
ncbi:MAG: cation-translocating P-type ATPase [Micavibrio aeruginosavorus]|uniref:Cation-translocating P-type ATPase n=1 Tax=Micavibrio aeruginosavorus TaxID=349221 RepID=A0A7T5R293_9BACT|nr:MAG: cation-translocating P-type ATPase [Micavibrio aeruginosavorus]